MSHELLLFEVSSVLCGIDSRYVRAVLRAATPTSVPGAEGAPGGLLNFHGDVLSVVNCRRLMGLDPQEMRPTDHLVVVEGEGGALVLHVDRALDVEPLEVTPVATSAPNGRLPLIEGQAKSQHGLVQVIAATALLSSRNPLPHISNRLPQTRD